MRKFLIICALAFMPILLFNSACSNSSGSYDQTGYSGPFNYKFLTANRGFIGGSLIWTPTGTGAQISSGTKIGVRIGKLTKTNDNVNVAAEPTQDSQLYEINDNSNPSASADSKFASDWAQLSGTPDTAALYDDDGSAAIYGYIAIKSASADAISFDFTRVSRDNSTSTKSFNLKKGDKCDICGSGIKNIKWDEPSIKRQGYDSSTRWLTFLNEDDATESVMFYTFSQAEVAAGYKSAAPEDSYQEGLYAVNSNGDFIYLCGSQRKDFPGASYGDYVICMPDDTDPSVDYTDIEVAEGYDGFSDQAPSDPEVKFGGKAYVVTGSDSGSLDYTSLDDFDNYGIDYEYNQWQFPDQNNGPVALVQNSDVWTSLTHDQGYAYTGASPDNSAGAISLLNDALKSEKFFNHVLETNKSKMTDAEIASCKQAWAAATTDALKKRYCRILVDKFYDASPNAVIEAPELGSIYPTMYANIGCEEDVNSQALNACRHGYVEVEDANSKHVNSSYNEFTTNRGKIRDEWAKYKHIDLTKVLVPKTENVKLDAKQAGFDIGFGAKLSVKNPKGQIKIEAAAALFIDIDLSLNSLSAAVDAASQGAIGKKMEELLKKYFSGPKYEVKLADVQIAGPLPFVVGAGVRIGLNVDLGAYSPHICFCGMYGAKTNLDIRYGIKWFCKPYLKSQISGEGIHPTEFYIGLEDKNAAETDIKFEPWVQAIPSFGVGYSIASIRASFPVKIGTELTWHLAQQIKDSTFKKFAVTLGVNFQPYAELDIKIVKLRYTFTNKTIMDHELEIFPNPGFRKRQK